MKNQMIYIHLYVSLDASHKTVAYLLLSFSFRSKMNRASQTWFSILFCFNFNLMPSFDCTMIANSFNFSFSIDIICRVLVWLAAFYIDRSKIKNCIKHICGNNRKYSLPSSKFFRRVDAFSSFLCDEFNFSCSFTTTARFSCNSLNNISPFSAESRIVKFRSVNCCFDGFLSPCILSVNSITSFLLILNGTSLNSGVFEPKFVLFILRILFAIFNICLFSFFQFRV